MNTLWAYFPLLVPALAIAGLGGTAPEPRSALRLARASALALWAVAAWLLLRPPHLWDALSLWYLLLVLVLGGLGLHVSAHYIGAEWAQGEVDGAALRRYLTLYEAFVLCLLAVSAASNYLLLWAAVEGTTLSTVLLVAFPGGPGALEAAWKYIVVTGAGGLLALIGTVLILVGAGVPLGGWGLAPPPHPASLSVAAVVALQAGLLLAVVGYGSKAGLVPCHTWLPDAHSEAPAPVSALLSGVKLVAGLYAILRLTALASVELGPALPHDLLIGLGLASLAVAAAAIVGQRDLKRLLAYSSIEHMGIIALGAGFGGVALLGALLHMWTHGFGKTTLFFGSGNVRLRFAATGGQRVRGLLRAMPLTGSALTLAAAAIVGLPPFGLFFSEWLVLYGGVRSGDALWAALALGLLVVALLGFGRRLPDFLLGEAPADLPGPVEDGGATWPLAVGVVGVLVAGLAVPSALHTTWLHAAALLGGRGAIP